MPAADQRPPRSGAAAHLARALAMALAQATGLRNPYLVMEVAGHESLETQKRHVHAKAALLLGGGRLIADVLGGLCPGLEPDVVRAEVDAAFDEAERGYGGPRLRSILFDAALYAPGRPALVTAGAGAN